MEAIFTKPNGEGRESYDGVLHVEHRSGGTVVLRFSGRKEFVDPDDYVRYQVQ